MSLLIKESYTYQFPTQDFGQSSNKLAGFDLDSTLIKTKSGRQFPKDKTDWEYLNEYVLPRLTQLYREGYNLIIFTNQSGLKNKAQKQQEFLWKLTKVIAGTNLPIAYVVSIYHNEFRKPMTGMFDFIKQYINDGDIDYKSSFYCGDAAGRDGDFAASDLYFATNCGLNFCTPEDMFCKGDIMKNNYELPYRPFLNYLGGPKVGGSSYDSEKVFNQFNNEELALEEGKKYIIVMVGAPASGKSYLSSQIKDHNHEFKFHIVSQDQIGSHTKMEKVYRKCIENRKNIIVDNTNPAYKKMPRVTFREFYIKVLRDYEHCDDYTLIAVNMTTSKEIIHQLNHFRAQYYKRPFINRVVYNVFNKYYEKPNEMEGFHKILNYENKPVLTGEARRVFKYYY